jgi:hypothetical protein
MLYPATPVVPRTTDGLQEFEDVLVEPCAPQRPVQRLPEKVCLCPTRGVLPAAGNHAPTMARLASRWPFPTTPVAPRRTDALIVGVEGLKDMSATPRPVQHLPSPTRGALLAGHHAPTLTTRPGAGGQRVFPEVKVGGAVTTRRTGGHGRVVGGGTLSTLGVAMLVGLVWGTVSVGAVFAPAGRDALKAAVGTCLSETADGSCPIFAASDATPGNSYGVIGDWDVSAVTSMLQSKCTLPF